MTDEIYLKNSLTVNNSIITLGDTDDSGKGRHFKSRFIQPGLAGYPGQYGNALIKKENLDKFVYTLRNKPVIINHKDEIEEKDKVGEVFNVWFNPDDGWYWCDGIITDVTAQNLIKDKGWSVSCSYNFTSYNDDGGTENNVPYDIEFLDGEFMHLAIVDKPRYEGANIVMNAKDKDNKGEWITVKGNHILVKEGQTKEEAVKAFIDKQESKKEASEKTETKETGLKKGDSVYLTSQDGPNKRVGKITKQISGDVVEVEFEAKGGSPARTDRYYIDELTKEFETTDKKETSKPKDKSGDSEKKSIKDVSAKDFDDLNKEDIHYYAKSQKDDSITFLSYENQNKNIKRTELFDSNDVNVFAYSDNRGELKIIATPKNENVTTSDIKEAVLKGKAKLDKKYVSNSTKVKEITMSVLNELESFVKGVIRNANDEDEKEIKNEKIDKRELIEEVGGMLKGKVDDEIIKTIIKKMEEASYDESEAGSADNKKVKNESEEEKEDKKAENKKVKNEESEDDKEKAEELKKDEKEDVDNKCNNSKTDFYDKMNKIYNSSLTPSKSETEYTSRADRLKAGEEYFKV